MSDVFAMLMGKILRRWRPLLQRQQRQKRRDERQRLKLIYVLPVIPEGFFSLQHFVVDPEADLNMTMLLRVESSVLSAQSPLSQRAKVTGEVARSGTPLRLNHFQNSGGTFLIQIRCQIRRIYLTMNFGKFFSLDSKPETVEHLVDMTCHCSRPAACKCRHSGLSMAPI